MFCRLLSYVWYSSTLQSPRELLFDQDDNNDTVITATCNAINGGNISDLTLINMASTRLSVPIICLNLSTASSIKTLKIQNMIHPSYADMQMITYSAQSMTFVAMQDSLQSINLDMTWIANRANLVNFSFTDAPWITGFVLIQAPTPNLRFVSITKTGLIGANSLFSNIEPTEGTNIIVDLSQNQILALPSGAGLTGVSFLNLSHNTMTGTLQIMHWSFYRTIAVLDFSHNSLSGNFTWVGSSKARKLNFGYNNFSGWPSFTATTFSIPMEEVDISNNHLQFIPDLAAMYNLKSFDCSGNNLLTGPLPSIAHPSRTVPLEKFWANGCGFNGTLPAILHATSSLNLQLRGNPIIGTIPNLWGSYSFSMLDLSSTQLDLCASNLPTAAHACAVDYTTACNCSTSYTRCSPICFNPATPSATPSDVHCPSPIPNGFSCIDGKLVASSSIDVPILVIPKGAIVEINGSLSTPSLVFSGLGSTISLTGCVDSLGRVTVTLSQAEIDALGKAVGKKLNQTLLQLSANCSDFANTTVITKLQGGGCKRVKTQTENRGNSLGVVFTLDTSKCNHWWIILVSVIGGVLLLVLIFALLVAFVPSIRSKIRPFSKRQKQNAGSDLR